ncbi:hypothetical protein STEG23_025432 [Scotinomys teguina]
MKQRQLDSVKPGFQRAPRTQRTVAKKDPAGTAASSPLRRQGVPTNPAVPTSPAHLAPARAVDPGTAIARDERKEPAEVAPWTPRAESATLGAPPWEERGGTPATTEMRRIERTAREPPFPEAQAFRKEQKNRQNLWSWCGG